MSHVFRSFGRGRHGSASTDSLDSSTSHVSRSSNPRDYEGVAPSAGSPCFARGLSRSKSRLLNERSGSRLCRRDISKKKSVSDRLKESVETIINVVTRGHCHEPDGTASSSEALALAMGSEPSSGVTRQPTSPDSPRSPGIPRRSKHGDEASAAERWHVECKTAYMREITALRDQIRGLGFGVTEAIDVTYYEPLKWLDDSSRNLVQSCVEEKLKGLIADADKEDSVLGQLIGQRVASRLRADLQQQLLLTPAEAVTNTMEDSHAAESDALAKRIDELQGEVAELQTKNEQLCGDLQDANTLVASQAADLEEADALAAAQEENLASSRAEAAALRERLALTEERAAAAAAVTEAATLHTAMTVTNTDAVGGQGAAPTTVTWSALDGALARESRPVLPGATAMVLMARAVDLHGQLEVAGRSDPASISLASDLLTVLEWLGVQLEVEVLDEFRAVTPTATAELPAVQMLVTRLAGARGESGRLRALCVGALETVGELLEAQHGLAGIRTKIPKFTDMFGKHLSEVRQCFLAAQQGWVAMEELRRLVRVRQHAGGDPSPPGAAGVTGTSDGGGATDGGSACVGSSSAVVGDEPGVPTTGPATRAAGGTANAGGAATQESCSGSQNAPPPRRISYSQLPFNAPGVGDAEADSVDIASSPAQQTSSQKKPTVSQRAGQARIHSKERSGFCGKDGKASDRGGGSPCDLMQPAVRVPASLVGAGAGSGGGNGGRRRASDGALSNTGMRVATCPEIILGSAIEEEQRCLALVSNPLRTSRKSCSEDGTAKAIIAKCGEASLRVAPPADTGGGGSARPLASPRRASGSAGSCCPSSVTSGTSRRSS